MSERNRKFWLCVFFMVLGLAIGLICGCYPDDPPVARRHCGSVSVRNIDTPEHATQGYNPRTEVSFPDHGTTNHPDFDFALAAYDFSGEFLDIGGIKIDTSCGDIWQDIALDKKVHITTKPSVYTQANGWGIGRVSCDSSETAELPFYGAGYTYKVSTPRAGNDSISATVGRSGKNEQYTALPGGEFWASGSRGNHISRASIEVQTDGRHTAGLSSIPLTNSDTSFLASNIKTDDACFSNNVCWQSPKYSCGQYQMKNIIDFDILNHNDNEAIAKYSTPYTCTYQFVTSESILLADRMIYAKLYIGDANEPNFVESIGIKIIADSNDLFRHVARSDYIVVCEPNNFTPYRIQSECGEILVVPLDEGQTLKIKIEDYGQLIEFIAPHWLTAFTPLDKNHDGIVNLKDLHETLP